MKTDIMDRNTNRKQVNSQGKPSVDGRGIRMGNRARKTNSGKTDLTKVAMLIGAAVLVFAVFAIINIVIGVRKIEVEGISLCTREEILEAAKISEGGGYFSYNTAKSEKAVKEQYPCVNEITVTRSFFGRVSVKVSEERALWYVESFGEFFALSEDLRVIKKEDQMRRFASLGLVRLDFPELKSAVLDKQIEIRDGGRDCSYVAELLENIVATEMYKAGRINQIEIKTKFEIFAVCDYKYKVCLGNTSDIDRKFLILENTLLDPRFVGEDTWEINVSDVGDAVVRKDYDLSFDYLKPGRP